MDVSVYVYIYIYIYIYIYTHTHVVASYVYVCVSVCRNPSSQPTNSSSMCVCICISYAYICISYAYICIKYICMLRHIYTCMRVHIFDLRYVSNACQDPAAMHPACSNEPSYMYASIYTCMCVSYKTNNKHKVHACMHQVTTPMEAVLAYSAWPWLWKCCIIVIEVPWAWDKI